MRANTPQETSRVRTLDGIIHAFGELVMIEKNADLPAWVDSDLSVSSLRAIYLLAYHGPLSIGALAGLLKIGNPETSILVQQLVERQLAERREDIQDRRRTFVRLTERGSALVNSRRRMWEVRFLRRLSRLFDEELSDLLRGIEALMAIIRAEYAQAGMPAQGADGAACDHPRPTMGRRAPLMAPASSEHVLRRFREKLPQSG